MVELNMLVVLSVAAFVAYLSKTVTRRAGMPVVTGYVVTGVILGISLLNVFDTKALDRLDIINDFALGIIGFTIGAELRRDVFQRLGRSILLIAMMESFAAFFLVTLSMFALVPSKPYLALILGSVASATAPAATVHVIHQYKAKGPLTSTILAVVGIDDAFALIIFAFASAVAKSMIVAEHISFLHILLSPVFEVGLSVILGVASGSLFSILFKNVRYPDDLLLGTAAFLLAVLGLSRQYHLSGLLAAMAFGSTVSNAHVMLTNRSLKLLENVSPLLFAYFFIFAGSHLDVGLLPRIGVMGLIYLVVRAAGKMGGASLGAVVGKASNLVKRFVGFALLPQVGVAVALAIMVKKEFDVEKFGPQGTELAALVINILLFTTLITEVVGPLLTKMALTKAGERETSREGA
jgi:Kef-type K+ transport system membrane component KefB